MPRSRDVETKRMCFYLSVDRLKRKIQEDFENMDETANFIELVKDKWGNPWLLVEFGRNEKSYHSQGISINSGLVGFCLNFEIEGQSEISLQFSNFFAFGYYPVNILNRLRISISELFGMASMDAQTNHLHEIRVDYTDYLSTHILSKIEDVPTQFAMSDFGHSSWARLSFTGEGWRFDLSTKVPHNKLTVRAPIEVLEFREFSFSFEDLDKMILNSEMTAALAEIERLREDFSGNLLLNRYQAFCYLSMDPSNDQFHMQHVSGDKNLIFYSLDMLDAITRQSSKLVLKNASLLGNYFTKIFGDIEHIKSFDMVMPDLLSEGWKHVELDNAILCLQRMAEKRGATKILYDKMVDFIAMEKDKEKRKEHIQSLLDLWTPTLITEIDGAKFVHLLWNNQIKDAASFAKEFATQQDLSISQLIELVKIIEYSGDIESCISILERKINSLEHKAAFEADRVELHLEIARLWIDGLGRIDFAKERLDKLNVALISDKAAIERALGLCQKVSHQQKEMELLISWLESDVRSDVSDQNLLHAHLKRLIEAFENYLDQSDVEDILAKYVDARKLPKSFIVQLVDYPEIYVNWKKIVSDIYESAEFESDYNKAYAYYIIGRISQAHPALELEASGYFESALAYGYEAKEIYEFFLHRDLDDEVKKAQILFAYLSFADDQALSSIYNQLLTIRHHLKSDQQDSFAIDLLIQTGNDEAMQGGLSAIGNGEIESLIKKIDERRAVYKDNHMWPRLLECVIEQLAQQGGYIAFKPIQDYLGELGNYIDTHRVYDLAVRYLTGENARDGLKPYLERMILDDYYPDLAPDLIIDILQDTPEILGRYYMHLGAVTKKKHKAPLYREAISCLEAQKDDDLLLITCIQELDACSHLTMHEFHIFMALCKTHDRLDDFVELVIHQIQILPKGALDLDLFHLIKNLLIEKKDLKDALLPILFDAVHDMQFDIRARLLRDLFLIVPDKWQYYDLHFGYDFLSDHRNWQNDPIFKAVFTWIASEEKNSLRLLDLCRNVFRRILSQGDTKRLTLLIDFLRQFDIRDKHANWAAFKYFVGKNDMDRAKEHWFEGIQILVSKEDVKRYLKKTKEFLSGVKVATSYESFVRFVYEVKNFNTLDTPIVREISLEKYLLAFKRGDFSEHNYHKIYDYYLSYPDEMRVWVPLFKLMQIYDQSEKLASLLNQIIDPLRANPSILDEYDLSIAIVEGEYAKFVPTIKPLSEDSRQDMNSVNSELVVHKVVSSSASTMLVKDEHKPDLSQTLLAKPEPLVGEDGLQSESTESEASALHRDGVIGRVDAEIAPKMQAPSKSPYKSWRQVCDSLPKISMMNKDDLINACKSKEEAHLCSQLVHIVTNDYGSLESHFARVWNSVDEYFYKRTVKLRKLDKKLYIFNPDSDPYGFAIPVLTWLGKSDHQKHDMKADRERVDVSDKLFTASRLRDYKNYWLSQSYSFFNHPGLLEQIIYRSSDHSFHFDREYWYRLPYSHFYHALSLKEAAVRLGYDSVLAVLQKENILSYLNQALRLSLDGDVKVFADLMVGDVKPFEGISKDELLRFRSIALRLRPFDENFVSSMAMLIESQLLYIQLYQSLDLIGLIGLLANEDIMKTRPNISSLLDINKALALLKYSGTIQV